LAADATDPAATAEALDSRRVLDDSVKRDVLTDNNPSHCVSPCRWSARQIDVYYKIRLNLDVPTKWFQGLIHPSFEYEMSPRREIDGSGTQLASLCCSTPDIQYPFRSLGSTPPKGPGFAHQRLAQRCEPELAG
jgi:hypothetical protein